MSKSIEVSISASEKDALKNIADFFYESISNFKRTLTDLSVSMNYFLTSLQSIEKQLGMHGFEFPENSSDILYERLTKNKEIRKEKQQEFIAKLIQNPITTPISSINIHPQSPQQLLHPEPIPTHKDLKVSPPPNPMAPISEVQEPLQAGPPVPLTIKPATASLDKLKKEMLETVRMLKKRIKDYK